MNVVITFVRDTPANVRRFVEANLSHGADHVLVLLDEPDPKVERFLAGHPHVTHAVLDDRFWKGARSDGLNGRQRVAAGLGRVALLLWGGSTGSSSSTGTRWFSSTRRSSIPSVPSGWRVA